MRSTQFSILIVLVILSLFSLNLFAQSYTQFSLPDGAKARFGKGYISGNVAYSPDGTRLAVASSIGIWLYDTATHQEVALLTGHKWIVTCVAFSPDSSTLASGSGDEGDTAIGDSTVRLWDAVTGQQKAILTTGTGGVYDVAFSPDGGTLAGAAGDGTVQLWDTVTGQEKATFEGHAALVVNVVFSPDGGTLASDSTDGTIILW